jgi:hypothetical protein
MALHAIARSITVALGSPDNLRSSIWRLWVQGDEVYFGALQLMPALKVSLHKSGKWHIAWCKSVTRPEPNNRVICKWRRPPPMRGFVPGISVVVDPFFPKQPFLNKAITDPEIKWLPLALYGKVLGLKTIIATKAADLDSSRLPPDERILARIPKSNGENVLLIAQNFSPPPWVWSSIAKWRSEIKIHYSADNFDKARLMDTTRALSISLPRYPHEAPAIYDLSLGWENVVADDD